ncbi:MAG: tetratricopeptide repeat protein [Bacteroidaceae bacterium]|nr:tetratricopeptide repeat protein [Bacteroidaceae bacterium]
MKNILPLFIVVYLLAVCSCQHRQSYPPQFLVADSLASVQPDSALVLLESLKADSLQWDKATQMYYSLLTIKAQDKAYISQTSDSLMLSVLHYYEHGGDKRLLPEAYYYMGRTYRGLYDAPRAVEYFQKALDVMPEGVSLLRRMANTSIGVIYYRQKLYDEALTFLQEAYHNDSILNDTIHISSVLSLIGSSYANKKFYTTALQYYERAKALSIEANDTITEDEIGIQLAYYYTLKGQYDEAKETIQPLLQHVGRYYSMNSDIYNVSADVYYHLGERDSALYYYTKLLEVGDTYGKQAAYEHLGLIAAEENRVEDEAKYFMQYKHLTDVIASSNTTATLAQMYSLYNYQKALQERDAINKRNQANRKVILYMSLALLVVALSVLILLRHSRLRRQAMQDKLDEVEQSQQMMRSMAEITISERNKRIDDLEKQLELIGNTNAELTKQIEEQRTTILQQVTDAEEKLNYRDRMDKALRESDIYAHLIYLINNKKRLSSSGFAELVDTFQNIAPEFMEKLLGLCVMNELEKEVTLLRRIGISPNDIALLTNYSKQHISGIRKGLYKKAKGIDGDPSQWDELIALL